MYVVLADKGIKYDGWVEDYPGDIKALRELEKYFKSVKWYQKIKETNYEKK